MRRLAAVLLAATVALGTPVASASPLAGSSDAAESAHQALWNALPPQARNHPALKDLAPRTPPAPARPAGCPNCVALTFDDGPAASTAALLDILDRHHVDATFFVLAPSARSHPDLIRRMRAAGHTIGNHTSSHPDLRTRSAEQVRWEIGEGSRAIAETAGANPRFLRPPYGATNQTVTDAARAAGQSLVLWDVDTLDWQHRNPDTTCRTAVDQARAGSIVLMHDIHPTTVAAVDCVISGLRAKGLNPVSLDQMIPQPAPGQTYTAVNLPR